jgi:hypothetical protein
MVIDSKWKEWALKASELTPSMVPEVVLMRTV